MDATLRIKNLSIALEALSRVNTRTSHEHSQDIEGLLAQEIRKEQKENEAQMQWPNRPTKPTVYDKDPYAKDDDIPF